jgi:2-dehydropantoate 2-reductase
MARIAIVGPGAIGGVMAAWLGRTGEHTVIVCARKPLAELVVETPTETIVARPEVFTDPAPVPAVDWVLVATKTYDSEAAAKWFPRLLASGAAVAVLQNGVEQRELFARWVSPDKIVPVLLYCPAERTDPTHIRQRRAARIDVPDDALGRAFVALFAGTPVAVTPQRDFQTALWRKLGVNVVGVLNTILLQPSGVFRDPVVAELARALTRECIAVARAEGANLSDGFAEEVLEIYRGNPPDSINSLHADRLAGRAMELDARNGVIIRLGHKHGIPTPYNHMAVGLLEAMTQLPASGIAIAAQP